MSLTLSNQSAHGSNSNSDLEGRCWQLGAHGCLGDGVGSPGANSRGLRVRWRGPALSYVGLPEQGWQLTPIITERGEGYIPGRRRGVVSWQCSGLGALRGLRYLSVWPRRVIRRWRRTRKAANSMSELPSAALAKEQFGWSRTGAFPNEVERDACVPSWLPLLP